MRGLRRPMHRLKPSAGLAKTVCKTLSLLVMAGLMLAIVGVPSASAAAPWWQISSETVPTNLSPGGEGQVIVVVSNLGDAPIDGSKEPVVITGKLPAGLSATEINGPFKNGTQVECTLATLTCSFAGVLNPYEQISVTIAVKVEEPLGTVTSLPVEAGVEGGGAANASRVLQVPVSGESTGFGVASLELTPFNDDATPATQAGAHPF